MKLGSKKRRKSGDKKPVSRRPAAKFWLTLGAATAAFSIDSQYLTGELFPPANATALIRSSSR